MAHESSTPRGLQLPTQVVGPVDVAHLLREMELLEDFLRQTAIRQPGQNSPKLPRISRLLDELVSLNNLNLLDADNRQRITEFLSELKRRAPVLHISFASDPSAAFIDKIVTWVRTNLHPLLLVRVGLEPSIGAGCIVRTTNRQFDFSLRQRFTKQRQLLIELLNGSSPKASEPEHVG